MATIESKEIKYTDGDDVLDSVQNIYSAKPAVGVAMSYGDILTSDGEVSSEPQTLLFTDFGFDVDSTLVSGIQVQLHVSRLGRIQDRLIQIWNGARNLGHNKANLDAEDIQLYGDETDLWKTRNLDFTLTDFGVAVDLQPHTQYPSNNTVYLRSIKMRLFVTHP